MKRRSTRLFTATGERHDDPSGGLLWVLLDGLMYTPEFGLSLVRVDTDEFLAVTRIPGGFYLFTSTSGSPMLVAFPVTFDQANTVLLSWNLDRDDWRQACAWERVPDPVPGTAPPALVRIAYEPGSHRTDAIGGYADGQFFAMVHGNGRQTDGHISVAMLLFDHHGTYVSSEIHDDVPLAEAAALRSALLDQLPDVHFGDIAIRPFSVESSGVAWELVDQTRSHGYPRMSFYPLDIMFCPPWSGTYDT